MNREELMAAMSAAPFEMAPVTVKGWGTFHIRELTAATVDKSNAKAKAEGDDMRRNAVIVACIVCSEKGELLFDVDNEADIAFLVGMGMSRLNAILKAANQLGAEDPGN
jgi:hypothetical protein